jgi:NAD(P)-dependent dehydrogenase (short-subunit alcohol dehydrogenase family)
MAERTFADQIGVVTGASQGIGRAIALGLAASGATVCLAARNTARLDEVHRAVEEEGGSARTFSLDVTDDAALIAFSDAVRRDYGRVDLLIHAAGGYARGALESAPVEEFDMLYRTNVRAPYHLTQLLLPLIAPARGQIVFINSTIVRAGGATAGLGPYAASKQAVGAIADALRDEVNPLGVRVVSVHPGRTDTPGQERVHALEGRPYRADRLLRPERVADVVIATLSLPRDAEVTNVTVRSAHKL